jgi:hypothetical protein
MHDGLITLENGVLATPIILVTITAQALHIWNIKIVDISGTKI